MEFIEILAVALVFFGGMALGALLTTLWYYCRSATATAGKTEATDHSSPDLRLRDRFCDWSRKKFPSADGLPAHFWQKNRKIFMLQKLHEKKCIHLRQG